MRVLYVIDSLAPGGAETSLAEMAPGLAGAGMDLHVLPLGPASVLRPQLEAAGAVVHQPVGAGRLANVRAVAKVARLTRPDLIHTTLFESDIAGRIAARLVGVPVSTSLVNDSYGEAHRKETPTLTFHAAMRLDRVTSRYAARFHAISAAVASRVAPRLGIDPTKIDVIPRGRDPVKYAFRHLPGRAEARHALGIRADAQVILAVGRLDPQKGLAHLLSASAFVAKTHPRAVVVIAGKEGRASDQVRAAAARAPLDVKLLGHRADIPELLTAADVFCFPSEREGLGGVLIEALAVGCPIVASRIPTSVEVLTGDDSTVGVLVPVGDERALGLALADVLQNPSLSARRAREGRAHFERHYTIQGVVEQMAAFFERARSS